MSDQSERLHLEGLDERSEREFYEDESCACGFGQIIAWECAAKGTPQPYHAFDCRRAAARIDPAGEDDR